MEVMEGSGKLPLSSITINIGHGFIQSRPFVVMAISRMSFSLLLCMFFLLIPKLHFCDAAGIITSTQPITERQTIISSNGTFKLGFFSPGNTSNRYVGIWYNKIPGQLTVVWVANRDVPLTDSSGVLTIGDDRNLVVLDGRRNIVWRTNVSDVPLSSHAELLDSGDLVLREGNYSNSNENERIIWQSFGDPSQTFLPGAKIGINQRTGKKIVLPSWKSNTEPSAGNFFLELNPVGIPQIIMMNGPNRHWRSGPWNGRVFIGVQEMNSVFLNGFRLPQDDQERSMYVTYSYMNKSILVRYFLNSQGILAERRWEEENRQWVDDWSAPQTECEFYGKCGPFGFCDSLSSPICSCLRGFKPKSTEEWSKGNWSSGCVRMTRLQCEKTNTNSKEAKTDAFLNFKGMKVPDFVNWVDIRDLKLCERQCLLNCSCIAYSYDTGTNCMWWSGNLIDIQKFSNGGVDLFIRVAHSEIDQKKNAKVIIIITILVGVAIGILIYISWRWMTGQKGKKKNDMEILLFENNDKISESADSSNLGDSPELPIFSFEKIAIVTNNFDAANKLGQGGFGPVYKGKLPDGQEIAVKRLSKSSGQGSEEFKNEVAVISKLQHRNLVRLVGCCIEREEKMLIYEYMPNKSLDAFVFDPTKRALLDWRKRFEIIMGICRGITYLHRDSRLRVIHRDLKASNILLDQELNPKISDFGMARIFGGDELQANTMRVVGTYGYMSPEYAMKGLFSEKSDVFSFGVLLLEIVSGKRNTSFHHHNQSWSLLGYAWKLWNEGKIQELIDSVISESIFQEEILRCIHVGLLCVQDFAKDRPTMSSVVSMLLTEITSLPIPKQPAFSGGQVVSDSDLSKDGEKTCVSNNVSITAIEGR